MLEQANQLQAGIGSKNSSTAEDALIAWGELKFREDALGRDAGNASGKRKRCSISAVSGWNGKKANVVSFRSNLTSASRDRCQSRTTSRRRSTRTRISWDQNSFASLLPRSTTIRTRAGLLTMQRWRRTQST